MTQPNRPTSINSLELKDKVFEYVLGSRAAKYPFQNPDRTHHAANPKAHQIALHNAWSLQWVNKELHDRVRHAVFRFGTIASLAAFARCPMAPITTIRRLELWITRGEAATIFDIEGLRRGQGLSVEALGLQETLRLCGKDFNLHRLPIVGFREDAEDPAPFLPRGAIRDGYLLNKEGRSSIGSMVGSVNGLADFLRVRETLGKAEIRRLRGRGRSYVKSEDDDSEDLGTDMADAGGSDEEDW